MQLPKLAPRASFYLQASIAVSFLAGSSAPTPLYAVYQAAWGFTPIAITIAFGIYAVAVLAALLTVGALSDHVGRRPVLLVATLLQAVVMIVFATADSLTALVVARVIQGLSTGAAVAAIGAGLLDLDRAKGTVANAVAPMTGTATGAILSGLMVQYLPAPTQLVYVVLLGVFAIQAVGIVLMPETSVPRPGAWASLRPTFRLPRAVRRPLLVAVPALVAAWALAGFYGSLGPTLLRRMAGSTSVTLGGAALFVLAAAGVLSVLAMRRRDAREAMAIGTLALVTGVAITLVAISSSALAVFFVGTAVAGAGFGAAFQGVIRTIVPLATTHERAGVLSILYVVSYLAMGVPAVIAGVLVVYGGGLVTTASEYGATVMALAALALLGTVVGRRRVVATAA